MADLAVGIKLNITGHDQVKSSIGEINNVLSGLGAASTAAGASVGNTSNSLDRLNQSTLQAKTGFQVLSTGLKELNSASTTSGQAVTKSTGSVDELTAASTRAIPGVQGVNSELNELNSSASNAGQSVGRAAAMLDEWNQSSGRAKQSAQAVNSELHELDAAATSAPSSLGRVSISLDDLQSSALHAIPSIQGVHDELADMFSGMHGYINGGRQLNEFLITGAANSNKAGAGFKGLGTFAQNAGYQVQDFAAQVAGGQSAIVALSQQMPQLLGSFGLFGALAGAGVAIGGALAATFLNLGNSAAEAEKRQEEYNKAFEKFQYLQMGKGAADANKYYNDINEQIASINAKIIESKVELKSWQEMLSGLTGEGSSAFTEGGLSARWRNLLSFFGSEERTKGVEYARNNISRLIIELNNYEDMVNKLRNPTPGTSGFAAGQDAKEAASYVKDTEELKIRANAARDMAAAYLEGADAIRKQTLEQEIAEQIREKVTKNIENMTEAEKKRADAIRASVTELHNQTRAQQEAQGLDSLRLKAMEAEAELNARRQGTAAYNRYLDERTTRQATGRRIDEAGAPRPAVPIVPQANLAHGALRPAVSVVPQINLSPGALQTAIASAFSTPSVKSTASSALRMAVSPGDRWSSLINSAASTNGLNPAVLRAVMMQESGGNPNARSPAGAVGLMQLMPGTARDLGVSDRTNPIESMNGGAEYLAEQIKKFGLEGGLAAYNMGPGGYSSYLSGNRTMPRETSNYVESIMKSLRGSGAATEMPVASPEQTAGSSLDVSDATRARIANMKTAVEGWMAATQAQIDAQQELTFATEQGGAAITQAQDHLEALSIAQQKGIDTTESATLADRAEVEAIQAKVAALRQAREAYDLQAAKAGLWAAQQERSLVGMSGASLARARAKNALEAQWMVSGKPDNSEELIRFRQAEAEVIYETQRLNEISGAVTDTIFNGFMRAAQGGESFKDALMGIATELANIAFKALVLDQLKEALGNLFAGGGSSDLAKAGGSSSGGILGDVLGIFAKGIMGSIFGGGSGASISKSGAGMFSSGFTADTFSWSFHDGGMVGIGGKQRYVHPAVFDGANRYHDGGFIGGKKDQKNAALAHDEVPAILQKGEVVISKKNVERMGGQMAFNSFHDGGFVDGKAGNRYIHPAVFDGAQRYHDGGYIGQSAIPASIQNGEQIARSGGYSGSNTIAVQLQHDINMTGDGGGSLNNDEATVVRSEIIMQMKALIAQETPNIVQKAVGKAKNNYKATGGWGGR